ncbi:MULTISPECIES: hypothetical protein [unclassified Actinopolyspora]|uniref:hypothetical protein n=1 Tax=unclassified Actinopolyspora TaxID=2639451 RepID=UPI0013F611DE|nr:MULTISPECIES: hypothetical protein [unclassified Actinopolyspora]NHD16399.1 hypothetical protein [Actinopolyspora sp. BKK2]NHE75738.1 hypothetical protein [Actinopolyspora sp. BKK1]
MVRHREIVAELLERARAVQADVERLSRLLGRGRPEVATWLPFAASDQEAVIDRLEGVLDELDGKDAR